MSICYSYIFSLLFLLLIAHWSNTASLRSLSSLNSSTRDNEISFQLPLVRRLRRWTKIRDNDEVEIPVNDTVVSVDDSDVITLSNSIENSTLLNFEIIESNSSIIQNSDDLINSTVSLKFNMTTVEVYSDDNTTIKYPLLRQDLTEVNQTTVSIAEEVLQDNKTDSQTLIANITDINQGVITHHPSDEFQSTPVPTIFNQTAEQVEEVTATILSNYTTVSYNETEDNQTNVSGLLFNDKTETISYNDSLVVTTSSWNISQKDPIITDEELHINDTEIIMIENNQNLTPKSIPIPICDHACQCFKECPYGFESINDTCQCNPPCKNYQCFGNDTCTVTDKGQPLCQPENGTKHDRPVRCYQPRDAGYHDNDMRYYNRWYYHPNQDTCHLFVYRGLGGNENNFATLQECHIDCIICAPSSDPGECFGQFDMWYYDNKKNECTQFEYSGCKGNENKFLKKEQCIDTCINRTLNL